MTVEDRPKALIMGASGAVGGALVRELVADPGPEGVSVRAAVRRAEVRASLERLGVKTVGLDLDGIDRLSLGANRPLLDALAGVDRLFLLTGYTVDMLVQSKAVVDAARASGVKTIVHLGALGPGDTTISHLAWHQLVERYIEWAVPGFTHLQPYTFMQNILRFSLRPGGVIHQFLGDARIGWIDVDDIARAAATVLRAPERHRGRTYRLAVDSLSVGEVAGVLSEVVGKPFRYEPRSPDEWLAGALAGGMEPTYARCVHNVFRRTVEGTLNEGAEVFGDYEELTGQKPIRWREHAAAHRDEFLRWAAP